MTLEIHGRSEIEHTLIALTRRDAANISGQAEYNAPDLFHAARKNDLDAVVAHTLMDALGSVQSLSRWRRAHEETQSRILFYLAELDSVASLLADRGIAVAALKNGGIARGVYPCAGCCPMGDLDLLVERRDFLRAHQALLDRGFKFEHRSPVVEVQLHTAEASGTAEYWRVLPNGETLWLELNWRPVAGRWIRPDQEPPAEELMARSIPIPGTAVRLLAPEDNLLQVALHTAKHSYVRAPGFRLHLDVERIVRHYRDLDWELFVRRVKALQVKTPVYFSLRIPKELLHTPIPEWVLAALRPSAWKERLLTHWIRRAGLFNPHEKKFGRVGYILFNALLYDDLRGLWRAIFPAATWMRQRYGFEGSLLLPYYHGRRLVDLAFRRQPT